MGFPMIYNTNIGHSNAQTQLLGREEAGGAGQLFFDF